MAILALDTTSEFLSMALWDGRRFWEKTKAVGLNHDELLVSWLDGLLRFSRMDLKDIETIAVASGPGRFTGIRIGLAFAKTLGQVLGRKVLGITALEALAFQRASQGISDRRIICPVIPAVRDEVFFSAWSFESGDAREILPASWGTLREMDRGLNERFGSSWIMAEPPLKAFSLAQLARKHLENGTGREAAPFYLKPGSYEAASQKRKPFLTLPR